MKTKKIGYVTAGYVTALTLLLSSCSMTSPEHTIGIGNDEEVLAAPPEEQQEPPPARLLCSGQLEGVAEDAVRTPLAVSKGRLLVGTSAGEGEANSSLYVFDTADCRLAGQLHTGAVQGPMVAMGDEYVALALGGGGAEERESPRLSLVELKEEAPGFAYKKEMDCPQGEGGSAPNALFDKGLVVHQIGTRPDRSDWILAAPANAGEKSRLLAYAPHETDAADRCVARLNPQYSDKKLNAPIGLTPIQGDVAVDGKTQLMSIHETNSAWVGKWVLPDESVWKDIQVQNKCPYHPRLAQDRRDGAFVSPMWEDDPRLDGTCESALSTAGKKEVVQTRCPPGNGITAVPRPVTCTGEGELDPRSGRPPCWFTWGEGEGVLVGTMNIITPFTTPEFYDCSVREYPPHPSFVWGPVIEYIPPAPALCCGKFRDKPPYQWRQWARAESAMHASPSGIAGSGGVVWLSGEGLQRQNWSGGTTTVLGAHWRTSPAVIDDASRAYVVVQTEANSYELWRFQSGISQGLADPCVVGDDTPCGKQYQQYQVSFKFESCLGIDSQAPGSPGVCQFRPQARSLPFTEAPVGSPLLGQPREGAPPEVYLVTTAGTVLAFGFPKEPSTAAELDLPFELLWKAKLHIRVSPEAQPVLAGGMLWVVGEGGQIRGVQVDSDGLNRKARWPKAFRDNCNTSSMLSSASALPGCF